MSHADNNSYNKYMCTLLRPLDIELQSIRLELNEANRQAVNRAGWRAVVKGLCLPMGEEK